MDKGLKAFLVICTFSAERSAQSQGVEYQARVKIVPRLTTNYNSVAHIITFINIESLSWKSTK